MIADRNSRTAQLSRRDILKGGLVAAGTLAIAGLATKKIIDPATGVVAASFIKGADVSYLQQMEAAGFKFKNNSGVTEDCLTILKGFGINAIRLRTWVNPSDNPTTGHCSQSETIAMAVRCRNAGLPCIIDFHFGDTFNSVGVQNPPAAWAKYSYSQMESAVSSYVYHFMNVMKYNSVTPGWVQLGNEINSGLLHPIGNVSNPSQMTGLIMAAHKEVKAVFSKTPTIIHLAQPQKLTPIYDMLDAYSNYGGQWDITGLSSYGTGSAIPGILNDMAAIQNRYNRPVMQVEFGESVSNPSGTKKDLSAYVNGVRNFGGLGVFYWEPEVYPSFNAHDVSGAWNDSTLEPTAALQGFEV